MLPYLLLQQQLPDQLLLPLQPVPQQHSGLLQPDLLLPVCLM
jgi:hypothetical protein